MHKSYTTQKLKYQPSTRYGSKICTVNEIYEGQFLYSSSINIFEVFQLATDYKKCFKSKDLLKITISGKKCC